jgi:hypothetical protein
MDRVRSYQPYWVTRAAVLDAMAAPGASAAREQAVRLTADAVVRAHLASGG